MGTKIKFEFIGIKIMTKKYLSYCFLLIIILSACNVEDLVSEFGNSKITAKEKLGEVINKAKNDFAADAQLSAIYGWNVDSQGEIDLQKPNENAFVYVVQSDTVPQNEFYIPVYSASPVRSPINFTTMLSFIKNNSAREIMSNAFDLLSEIHIDASAGYSDSPVVLDAMFSRSEVSNFISANPGTKIDMFLVPSKSIDSTLSNAANWIVNFYGDTSSLVLWQRSDGNIIVLTE
jgi:hypothetical protein